MLEPGDLSFPPPLQSIFGAVLAGTVTILAAYLVMQERTLSRNLVLQERNFYGALQVRDDGAIKGYPRRTLRNGTIDHGWQLLDPESRFLTTSYYGTSSGIGRAMSVIEARGPIRAGLIGLGAGVLFNYGRSRDYLRVY